MNTLTQKTSTCSCFTLPVRISGRPTKAALGSTAFLKIMVGMCAAALLISWAKIHSLRSKPAETVTASAVADESEVAAAPASAYSANVFNSHATAPSNASVGSLVEAHNIVFSILAPVPELNSIDEPKNRGSSASFQVASNHVSEMQAALEAIVAAKNNLAQTRTQIAVLSQALQKDKQDYLAKLKDANESAENDRSITAKKLLEVQELYFERKQQYLQTFASLQIFLQDTPPLMDQKLVRRQQEAGNYLKDMGELEKAISKIKQEIYDASQGKRQLISMIEVAYWQSFQDLSEAMSNARGSALEQVRSLNSLIGEYNAKLQRYGAPIL